MRLTKLKIAGFKSFVDPTTVTFPSSLTGIVGPNGCGKSNIIDAVRWVMGEISAKHLRGESMADVIFNGSAARKPLGAASVDFGSFVLIRSFYFAAAIPATAAAGLSANASCSTRPTVLAGLFTRSSELSVTAKSTGSTLSR